MFENIKNLFKPKGKSSLIEQMPQNTQEAEKKFMKQAYSEKAYETAAKIRQGKKEETSQEADIESNLNLTGEQVDTRLDQLSENLKELKEMMRAEEITTTMSQIRSNLENSQKIIEQLNVQKNISPEQKNRLAVYERHLNTNMDAIIERQAAQKKEQAN